MKSCRRSTDSSSERLKSHPASISTLSRVTPSRRLHTPVIIQISRFSGFTMFPSSTFDFWCCCSFKTRRHRVNVALRIELVTSKTMVRLPFTDRHRPVSKVDLFVACKAKSGWPGGGSALLLLLPEVNKSNLFHNHTTAAPEKTVPCRNTVLDSDTQMFQPLRCLSDTLKELKERKKKKKRRKTCCLVKHGLCWVINAFGNRCSSSVCGDVCSGRLPEDL